jgi:hypothetical protein
MISKLSAERREMSPDANSLCHQIDQLAVYLVLKRKSQFEACGTNLAYRRDEQSR